MSEGTPSVKNKKKVTSSVNLLGAEQISSLVELRTSSPKKTSTQDQKDYLRSPVPIYSLSTTTHKFGATIDQPPHQPDQPDRGEGHPHGNHKGTLYYFAQGDLVGHFYSLDQPVVIRNCVFFGYFKGFFNYQMKRYDSIYFQGKISQLLIIRDRDDPTLEELSQVETSFRGFFRGHFYELSKVDEFKNINISLQNIAQISTEFDFEKVREDRTQKVWSIIEKKAKQAKQGKQAKLGKQAKQGKQAKWEKKEKKSSLEYFLPTVVRFQIQDIRQINLEKSMAVISGTFYIDIKFNKQVDDLVDKCIKSKALEKLLEIQLHFQRDSPITLDLADVLKKKMPSGGEERKQEQEAQSQGSEWSIQDATQDIQFQKDIQQQLYSFRVWKRFNTEIDNSYGSLFAPFNLSVLRIVLTLHHFQVKDEAGNLIKVHLVGTDVEDYNYDDNNYNPFLHFSNLKVRTAEKDSAYSQHENRLHKINRLSCRDSGTFVIADNRLTLFPFYRNVLINKNTANEKTSWNLGLADKYQLIANPTVRSIRDSFQYYENNVKQVETFTFQKWQYVIIEVPVYKYIVIDMLLVFIPLFLLSAISLLIFNQANGISDNSGFTTLAYRLVNVSSMMIAYVSLVPVIRENLPPMPGITLVEVLTYLCTLPNFLAMVSSLLSNNALMNEWQHSKLFMDSTFVIAFVLTSFSVVVLVIMLCAYMCKDYSLNKGMKLRLRPPKGRVYEYRSPGYLQFMEQTKERRLEYTIQSNP